MKNIVITEEQLKFIVENIKDKTDELKEYYDSDKLYAKSYIEDRLKKAPRYIKKYAKDLEEIERNRIETRTRRIKTKGKRTGTEKNGIKTF